MFKGGVAWLGDKVRGADRYDMGDEFWVVKGYSVDDGTAPRDWESGKQESKKA